MANGGTTPPDYNPQTGNYEGPSLWNPVQALDWLGQQAAGAFNYGSTARPGGYPTGPQPAPQPPQQLTTQWAQAMGDRASWLADIDYDRNKNVFEAQIAYWDNIIKDADNPIIKEGAIKRKEEIEVQLQQAEVRKDASAQAAKAIPAVLQNPNLVGQWEELVAEYGISEYYKPSAAATYDLEEGGPQPPQAPIPGLGLDVISPLASQAPTDTLSGYPTAEQVPLNPAAGTGEAIRQLPIEFQGPEYAQGSYIGGFPEGTGTTLSPFTGPEQPAGGGGGAGGIPGVPTPGFRGFETYEDLRRGMEASGRGTDQYGRTQTGMLQPWEFQNMYNNQYSEADSLQQYLGRQYEERPGESYRGRTRQTIDMGQGIQDYHVRRDAYGNIRSYMPASSSSMTPDQRLFRRY